MVVNQATVIEFYASLNPETIATQEVEGASATASATFDRPTCTIRAELRGALVEIAPQDNAEKSFVNSDELKWSWQVVPQSVEAKALTIELSFVINVTGGLRTLPMRTATLKIEVNTAPKTFLQRVEGVAGQFSAALTTALIAGMFSVLTAIFGLPKPVLEKLNLSSKYLSGRKKRKEEKAYREAMDGLRADAQRSSSRPASPSPQPRSKTTTAKSRAKHHWRGTKR